MSKSACIVLTITGFLLFNHKLMADVPFPTSVAQYQTIAKQTQVDGVIEAVNRSTVSAQTSGRITEVNFDIGDYVKANSVLVRISKVEQQPQLAAADAVRQEAEARLTEAEAEHARITEVYRKKLVAKSAMDKANADLKSAKQRYVAAKAKAKQAKARLTYTTVRAPYSGYVVKRFVDMGETVAPGKPIMSGLSLDQLRATAYIPQALITQVRSLTKAIVETTDNRRIESESIQVSPQADPSNHAYLLRIYLPERTQNVLPGMFVKLKLNTGEQTVLLVPPQALVRRSELTGIYVLDKDQRVILRQVRVGHSYPGGVEVLSGLTQGERIALDPIAAGIYLKEYGTKRKGNSNE